MKFIATGDFGGNVEIVAKLLDLRLEEFNFVVFTGDLIAMKELRKMGEATARGFKPDIEIRYDDIKNRLTLINQILAKVGMRRRVYGILGNSDLRRTFISLVPKVEFEDIHNRIVQFEDYFLIGYGGRPMNVDELKTPNEIEKAGVFPGRTYGDRAQECNAWREEEAYKELSGILRRVDPRKCILVTHYPPYQILDKVEKTNIPWAVASYGEVAKDGNIGSQAFRQISQEFEVLLHIFSHVHESKGIQRVGNTVYLNIGSLEDNRQVCQVEAKDGAVDLNFLET